MRHVTTRAQNEQVTGQDGADGPASLNEYVGIINIYP